MEPYGQSWLQLVYLGTAFVLSSAIGLERELKMRSAGLRTCTLIGIASALLMLVSKYGFSDVLDRGRIVLDPSRVAAQIASGIGFVGGGLIFVRQDVAHGLTTAATVWLVAAVGMACGAGLLLLALSVAAAHFVVVYAYTPLVHRIQSKYCELAVGLSQDAALALVLEQCVAHGFAILDIVREGGGEAGAHAAQVKLRLKGDRSCKPLLETLQRIGGLHSIRISPPLPDHRA